jgi:hypothetical protein
MTFNVKQYYLVFWPCRPFGDLNFIKVTWYCISRELKLSFWTGSFTHTCVGSEICALF